MAATPDGSSRAVGFRCPVRARGLLPGAGCAACASFPDHDTIRIERRELLYMEGDEALMVYALVRGVLRETCTDAEGRVQALRLLTPGELVGTESLAGTPYQSTVEALGGAELCRIPARRLEARVQESPEQAVALMRILAEQTVAMSRTARLFGPRTAEERLLDLLAQITPHASDPSVGELPLTRSDIAELLGLARATVSRLLTRLVNQGRIELQGRSIRLL